MGTHRYGAVAYSRGWIARPGDVLVVMNSMVQALFSQFVCLEVFGSFFLGLLGPHLMNIVKARVSAAVLYKIIDEVR